MDIFTAVSIGLTIVGTVIGGIAAYFQYKQYQAQHKEAKALEQKRHGSTPDSSGDGIAEMELGEPFRRYLATVINRPFYPLVDQVEILEKTRSILRGSNTSFIVVLTGVGGVGKTTIAAEVVRQSKSLGFLKPLGDSAKLRVFEDAHIRPIDDAVVLEWEDLINAILLQLGSPSLVNNPLYERESWVKRQFRLEAYLVLVDNLETTENARNIATSLRNLLSGTNSRGLITYRYSDLGDLNGVFTITVVGLSLEDSHKFLQQELQSRGYKGLEEWLSEKGDTYETLNRVIELTRGLPLALQLVIGLHVLLPLSSVYDLLSSVTADTRVEELYMFLYREELRLLSVEARKLLTSAFSKKPGYFRSELIDIIDASAEDILARLTELSRFSLIISINRERPDIGIEDYFYIHPMLHELLARDNILGWIAN